MVLDSLGDSLRSSLDELRGTRNITESDVKAVSKDVQRSLIEADVDVSIVKKLSDTIEDRALSEDPPTGVTAREHILNIVYEELVSTIGDEVTISLENQTILLVGLQGSGKTTTSSKLGWWFSKKGLTSSVVQTDTFRPGAYEQSNQMTSRADIGFYGDIDEEDPVAIAEDGLQSETDSDVTIVDTAGRHSLEEGLVDELEDIYDSVEPDLTLLVIDAAIGKGVKDQAKEFQDAVGIDGVVITKMDGTAKGGGALTAVNETNSGVAFIGTGETVKDIERFEPDGFISRLLGMGDLSQLQERIENAQYETDDDWEPEDVLEGEFTLKDMQKQLQSMNEMGPLEEVLGMIPGMGNQVMDQLDDSELQVKQEKLRNFEIIIDSMTEEELENPSTINNSRKKRIARGSGKDISLVEDLLEQYNQMSQLFNRFNSESDMKQMAQQLQGGGGGGNLPF